MKNITAEISIHTSCEGSDLISGIAWMTKDISIHTSCEGSDPLHPICAAIIDISIHTSCEGSDLYDRVYTAQDLTFQSTLPVKEVTSSNCIIEVVRKFQSTLPVKEVTELLHAVGRNGSISIHTSCEGSDQWAVPETVTGTNFNPHFL